MQDYEKLGQFYLGRMYDMPSDSCKPDLLLYDAKDLTTHAVCVGMTGSGKTGLCITLLEEAVIDGIPAIVIDPKGDLGNMLLAFPGLQAAEFRPWIDEGMAERKGMTPDQYAASIAKSWADGLKDWGQDGSRIERFRAAADFAIYTPASNAGLPLTVLRSFAAPPESLVDDVDAFRERVAAATSGLLALLGIDADPVRSREHILISNLLDRAWREGRDMDIARLIQEIQSPPFEQVGILDLESFFPARERVELSMTLNNLLASPSFASWMSGDPLDVKRLLYTPQGKPRLAIISIAHLSDAERMFFVTILLNEVLVWMRSQPGTSSLRALLYMDEVFGYFPPTANPPSKQPMLTLLKQARAYGLGVVLATQNPVDLDYKGLSNTGTWFLGKLQTERDKARVLEGLEGVSATSGVEFDRQRMEATLAGLGSRVFLMHNVHEDEPVTFQTRWALSYLRGPLTRSQIQTLMAGRKKQAAEEAPAASSTPPQAQLLRDVQPTVQRAIVPQGIKEFFPPVRINCTKSDRLVYRPALLGQGRIHFVKSTYKVDLWKPFMLLLAAHDELPGELWQDAIEMDEDSLELEDEPQANVEFSPLPAALSRAKKYTTWKNQLKNFVYRSHAVRVFKFDDLRQYSEPDEPEDDFRIRLSQLVRERRDLDVEKLRKRFTGKLTTLQGRLQRAEQRVEREEAQYKQRSWESALSIGSTVLGAVFGRKLGSRTNVGRTTTSMRSVGRAASERGDVSRAKENVELLQDQLKELEEKFQTDVEKIEDKLQVENLEFAELRVPPRKSDIQIAHVALVWTPWKVDASGIAEPAY